MVNSKVYNLWGFMLSYPLKHNNSIPVYIFFLRKFMFFLAKAGSDPTVNLLRTCHKVYNYLLSRVRLPLLSYSFLLFPFEDRIILASIPCRFNAYFQNPVCENEYSVNNVT